MVKYHGGETTQEKLREISGTTLNGTSLLGLYQAAQKLGIEVGGYETDIKNLKEQKLEFVFNQSVEEPCGSGGTTRAAFQRHCA